MNHLQKHRTDAGGNACPLLRGFHNSKLPLRKGFEDRLFRREVVEEGSFGDVCGLSNVLDRSIREAALCKQTHGAFENAGVRLLAAPLATAVIFGIALMLQHMTN